MPDDSYSYSVSPEVMRAIAQIESGGNPNAVTGSYKGLYQLSDPEYQRYGGAPGKIFDPEENTRVATLRIQDVGNQLAKALGRPVTPDEVYLAHQQGVGGATAHLTNPDQPAWQSMASTGEGRQKGEEWAKRAIWGNIPDQQKAQFGNVNNVTSGQFAQLWNARLGRAMGQPATLVPGVSNNTPAAPAMAPGTPLQIAPQQVPIFPQAPQQAQPQQASGGGGPDIFSQMEPPQAPQIYYAPRRSPDLSKLRAAFQSPIFPRRG